MPWDDPREGETYTTVEAPKRTMTILKQIHFTMETKEIDFIVRWTSGLNLPENTWIDKISICVPHEWIGTNGRTSDWKEWIQLFDRSVVERGQNAIGNNNFVHFISNASMVRRQEGALFYIKGAPYRIELRDMVEYKNVKQRIVSGIESYQTIRLGPEYTGSYPLDMHQLKFVRRSKREVSTPPKRPVINF